MKRWIRRLLGCRCEELKEELKAAPSWISVNDRLPEGTQWVLAYGDGAVMTMAFYCGKFVDWNHSPCPNVSPDSVTHWMPIPDISTIKMEA